MVKKLNSPLSYYLKLQDGGMVRQHSDHILACSETETIPVANDDWMNLLNIQMLHLILLYDILQDYPFH